MAFNALFEAIAFVLFNAAECARSARVAASFATKSLFNSALRLRANPLSDDATERSLPEGGGRPAPEGQSEEGIEEEEGIEQDDEKQETERELQPWPGQFRSAAAAADPTDFFAQTFFASANADASSTRRRLAEAEMGGWAKVMEERSVGAESALPPISTYAVKTPR